MLGGSDILVGSPHSCIFPHFCLILYPDIQTLISVELKVSQWTNFTPVFEKVIILMWKCLNFQFPSKDWSWRACMLGLEFWKLNFWSENKISEPIMCSKFKFCFQWIFLNHWKLKLMFYLRFYAGLLKIRLLLQNWQAIWTAWHIWTLHVENWLNFHS